MERIVKFHPAWDKRSSIPEENFGIGAVSGMLILMGDEGAVSFLFSTGIYLPNTIDHLKANSNCLNGMGIAVGYHSLEPNFEGQKEEKCDVLKEGKGYCGMASFTLARNYFNILVRHGDEFIWTRLEKYYKEIFDV